MNAFFSLPFVLLLVLLIAGFCVIVWYVNTLNKKTQHLLDAVYHAAGETNLLSDLLSRVSGMETAQHDAEPRIQALERYTATSIRKTGFLRFNPFSDTGGDNSFIVALLDNENNGVLISSLYMRDGMRVYGKAVEGGKCRYPLSEEEKKVLANTLGK